jgi:hypothetical protein
MTSQRRESSLTMSDQIHAGDLHMALIQCPECQKAISETVTQCPHCGFTTTAEVIATQKKKQQATTAGCAILVAGLLFAVLCAGVLTTRSGPSTPYFGSASDDVAAPITFAKEFVRQRLKAPATASFPWAFSDYNVINLSAGRWSVAGYVDTQNGFGATIRTRWTVEMEDQGGAWKLINAQID